MFKKNVCIILVIALIAMLFPTVSIADELSQYLPINNKMEDLTQISSTDNINKSLTQDRVSGKYAVKITAGDIANQTSVDYTIATSTYFYVYNYSQIQVWVKPGAGAKWIEFLTANCIVKNDKDSDGIFKVGQDIVSGKWNLITLDLTKTSNPSLTQAKDLIVSTNDNSTWYFDDITSVYAPVYSINPADLVNDQTQVINGSIQFKTFAANTYNTNPTILVSQKYPDFNYTVSSQSGFVQGTMTNLVAKLPGSLELKNGGPLSAGQYHNIAFKNDGTAWGWGYNYYGQVGDGTGGLYANKSTPVQVSGLTGVIAVATGGDHSLAVKNNGTVWAWGWNYYGQLGDGTTTNRYTPVQVSGLTGVIAIAAGYQHSFALKSDGTLWAWGYNADGELGDGTTISRYTPVQVLNGVSSISAGYNHSLALKNDGTLWAWGYNYNGQLGDGTTTNRITPIQITGLIGITAISGGGNHSLALKNDGTLWAWGKNGSGQLGDGTLTQRTTPVQVTGLTGVIAIAAGNQHSLALKSDGTLWAWGYNGNGELGDGTTLNKNTPVFINYVNGATEVAAGYSHSIATNNDGTMWAWGYNYYGQLGDGTITSKTTPELINGITSKYVTSGSWVMTISLPSISAENSIINWNSITPNNTNITVETNVYINNQWQGWQTATNGGSILGISNGTDLTNTKIQSRVTLTSTDGVSTPKFNNLIINIIGTDKGIPPVLPNGNISSIYVDSQYYSVSGVTSLASNKLYLSGLNTTVLSLSGDGTRLFYKNPADNKLYLLNLSTGTNNKISDCIPTTIKSNYDGTKAAFKDSNNNLYLYGESSSPNIFLLSANVSNYSIQKDESVYYFNTASNSINSFPPNKTYLDTFVVTASGLTNLDIAREAKQIFYSNGAQLYNVSSTTAGWVSNLIITASQSINGLWVNKDGTLVFLKLADGNYYSFQVSSKALRKLNLQASTMIKVTDDNGLVYRDPNNRFQIYNPDTDSSTDIRPTDANSVNFDVDYNGNKMVYYNGGLSTHYINGVQRPERFLFSFDGKNSWQSFSNGTWVTVKSGAVPVKTDFDLYGMTIDEVNNLDEADFASLYEDGRQVLHFDVAEYFASVDAYTTPSLNSIKVIFNGGETGEVPVEKSLYVLKNSDTFDTTRWRKIRKIYPIEITPKDAEIYYFIQKNNGPDYLSYRNGTWTTVTAGTLSDIEGNWINISQNGMTADEIRSIPESHLGSLISPTGNLVIKYAMKVDDLSTEGYSSLITIDYVQDLFVSANLVLKITLTDGTVKQYSGLTDTQVEDFMEWLSERQYNRGPIFYCIKVGNTNSFINYYSINYVDVDEM